MPNNSFTDKQLEIHYRGQEDDLPPCDVLDAVQLVYGELPLGRFWDWGASLLSRQKWSLVGSLSDLVVSQIH